MNQFQNLITVLLLSTAALFISSAGFTHAATTTIDNTDPGFSVTGTWPTSTVVSGFEGSNYQHHFANGSAPGAITVDNTDPEFSVTGTWPTSTVVSGFFGSNYQHHFANGDEPSAIIVDNPNGTATGTWPTSTHTSGFFGANYQFHATGTGSNTFTWTPVIPSSDSYNVYARWTAHPNRASDAKYTVTHAGGNTVVTVNQKQNNGIWMLLGTFTMDSGQGHQVSLSDDANGFVIADAVKVVPVGALPSTATWTPTVPVAGSYKVFARWTQHPNRATDAQYTVKHDGGDTVVSVDQQVNGGQFNLLGTFNLTPGQGHGVSLTDQANGFVIADAVQILDANAPEFNAATWTPNVAPGQYEVYAKWTEHPNRATNATYTINHTQGTAVVIKSQEFDGGQFNLLGTFSLDGSSTIMLDDRADGFVIADAIQLVSIDNTAPIANAGGNLSVNVGTVVNLDGSASSDQEGNPLTFQWTFISKPAASQASLTGATTATPSFTADVAGNYVVGLIVNDGQLDSAQDQVLIEASVPNGPPVLGAIGDQTVDLGTTLTLTVSATDPDGDTLQFSAQPLPLPEGATLNTMTGEFEFEPTTPQAGSIPLTFIVSDGVTTDTESITITVPAPNGSDPTELSGRLLDANSLALGTEVPIVGGTVSILNTAQSAISDANGNFTITNLAGGSQILDIDASTAAPAPDGSTYAGFREEIELIANVDNIETRPFSLPRIDATSLTTVNPAVTTVVTNPGLNISLTVAPNTAKNPDGTDFTGQLSISAVPPGLAPAALPDFLETNQLITIQPVGVTFSTPAAITLPNTNNYPVGNQVNIWSLDAENGVFHIVGIGEVSPDGLTIQTVTGGIRAADWYGEWINQSTSGPLANNLNQDLCKEQGRKAGSVASLCTGGLSETHQLVPYFSQGQTRQLELVYNSVSADPSPVIGNDILISRLIPVPDSLSARLSVGGVNQGQEFYTSTAGLSESLDEPVHQAVQFDASGFPTGSYDYRLLSTNNFSNGSISGVVNDKVLINNEENSPFGSGWTLSGLHKIHLQNDGQILLTKGDGSILRFAAEGAVLPISYQAPPQDYSTLVQNANGTFTRTTKFGMVFEFDAQGLLTQKTDRNGNTTTYSYNQGLLTSITDPVGKVMIFTYTNGLLTSITDPASRVTSFAHNGNGDLTQITDPDSSVRSFGYDADHHLTTQTSKRGFITTYEYTFSGHFSRSNRPDGTTREMVAGQTFGLIDPAGSVGTTPSNPAPFVRPDEVIATFTGGKGEVTQYETDRFGAPTKKIDPNAITTITERDESGIGAVDGTIIGPVGFTAGKVGLAFDFTQPNNSINFGNVVGNFGTGDFTISFWIKTDNTMLTGLLNKRPLCDRGSMWGIRKGGGVVIEVDDGINLNAPGTQSPFITDGQYHLINFVRQGNTVSAYADAMLEISNSTPGVTNVVNSAPVLMGTGPCVPFPGTVEFAGQLDEVEFYDRALTQAEIQTLFDNGNNGVVSELGATHRWSGEGNANGVSNDNNAQGLPTKVIRPDLSETTNLYDDKGNLTTRTEGFNGATTETTYDPQFSLAASLKDPENNTTTFTRNVTNGDLETITNALTHQTQLMYNAAGQVTQMTDANGLVTSITYNATSGMPEIITETPPAGGGLTRASTITYDAAGQIKTVTTPTNILLTFNYDLNGRVSNIVDSLNQRIEFVYDEEGNRINNQTLESDGSTLAFTMMQTFDTLNRLATSIQPHIVGLDSVQQFEYDGTGNLDRFIDPKGQESTNQYDTGNRHTSQINALIGTTSFTYNDNGDLTRVVSPNGAQTDYAVDSLGRITTETSPDRGVLTYTYDLNNNLKTLTDARGITRTLDYDVLNRLTSITFPNTQENVSLSYDNCTFGVGRLCSFTDESGTTSMQYDAHGNVTNVAYNREGINYTQVYQYDAGNRVSSLTLPSGRQITYQRDGLQRINQISSTVNAQNLVILDQIGYNANDQITQRTFSNGLVETRSYDLQSRLLDIQLGGIDTTNLTYDANSNVLTRNTTSDTHSYSYDVLDRIDTETNNGSSTSYQFDTNDNRLNQTEGAQVTNYVYSPLSNRLDTIDSASLSYDTAGNLTVDGQGRDLIYNNAGRLIEIQNSGQTLVEYRYGNNGLRSHKISSSGTIIYHYDQFGNLISETTDTGISIRDYIWHQNQPVGQIDVSTNPTPDSVTYIHTDHLNTARLATDLNQAITWRWEGKAFGNTQPQNLGSTINLRFPGQYADAESGFNYNHFRYYDPETGRYISSDPVGTLGGSNTYVYVRKNPLIFIDPTGLIIGELAELIICSLLEDLLGRNSILGNLLGDNVSIDLNVGGGRGKKGVALGLSLSASGVTGSATGGPGVGAGISLGVSKTFDISSKIDNLGGVGTKVVVTGGRLFGGAVSLDQGTGGVSSTVTAGIGFGGGVVAGVTGFTKLLDCEDEPCNR